MSDLIAFLTARLDEDEAAAKEAASRPLGDTWTAPDDGTRLTAVRRHIRRYDPARVLREVEAKRAIVAEHQPGARFAWNEDEQACQRCGDVVTVQWPCSTVRSLAAVYSDHPDYPEALSQYRQKHDPDLKENER